MSKSKLLDTKINTAFEVRALAIAKAEAAKTRVRCIYRDFMQGNYNPATNAFSDHVVINFTGQREELGPIPRISEADNISIQGTRTADAIKVTGFGVDIKVSLEENQSLPLIQESIFVWRLVGVYDDWVSAPAVPSVDELLKWYQFGYSPMLDVSPDPVHNTRKVKTFMKGKVFLRGHDAAPRDRTVSRYLKLKNPLLLEYNPDAADPDVPLKWRFYFVCRSNIPDAHDDNIAPRICSAIKLYYFQP